VTVTETVSLCCDWIELDSTDDSDSRILKSLSRAASTSEQVNGHRSFGCTADLDKTIAAMVAVTSYSTRRAGYRGPVVFVIECPAMCHFDACLVLAVRPGA